MKLFFMNMMTMINFMFIFLTHPMSMGLTILLQMMMSIILMNFFLQLFWFSYMLFLMLIGGMLILFMYMCSISSNNIIFISPKLMILILMLTPLNLLISLFFLYNENLNYNLLQNYNSLLEMNSLSLNFLSKMFNDYSSFLTLFLILYLFILMILVNKITNFNVGPLRKTN
uniref:NADH dehydrogenase subunit 6 n=1 Tax=Wormaldia unispina TaxID=2683984 RepID=UPI0022DCD8F2|nr:NADH dehydrogenase subunit 6 [Wormaldia unispina]UZZ44465.1 NADH dehydrogenase subunit 6 [Wormaldia unispina]